VKLAA